LTARPKDVIYELPLKQFYADCSWAIHSIGQLADVLGGGTPDTGVIEFWEPPEIPWATPTDITATEGNEIRVTERCISTAGLKQSTLVPEDSILMTSRATIGAAKINRVPMAINQGFAALCAKDGHSADYLFYLLDILRPTLIRLGAGTTFLETSRREIRKVQVRVPQGDEQRLIVVALKLADDALQKARVELEAARELKRSLMNSMFSIGIPGRHTDFQETKIGPIPQGWRVRMIRSVLADKADSGTSPLSRPDPPGTPILNVSCVKEGVCSPADVTYVDVSADEIERYRAHVGDFFVLRGNGNRDLVATGGLLRQSPVVDTIYSDKLIRLRFNAEEAANRFVPYLWQSRAFLTRLQSKAESGSGLWMMSKRDICREIFACPPINEQKEIVELLDRAEDRLNAQDKRVEAIMDVKRSLLQNLLTGKIRIPEGAIHA
jgi:type I restriction enzyme, S subunit